MQEFTLITLYLEYLDIVIYLSYCTTTKIFENIKFSNLYKYYIISHKVLVYKIIMEITI